MTEFDSALAYNCVVVFSSLRPTGPGDARPASANGLSPGPVSTRMGVKGEAPRRRLDPTGEQYKLASARVARIQSSGASRARGPSPVCSPPNRAAFHPLGSPFNPQYLVHIIFFLFSLSVCNYFASASGSRSARRFARLPLRGVLSWAFHFFRELPSPRCVSN